MPLDGSRQSETVFPFLQQLAVRTEIDVTLIRCYEPISEVYSLPPDLFALDTYTEVNEAIPGSLKEYLEAVKEQLGKSVSNIAVKCGPATSEILAASESGDFDLIVMASHGRRGLDRLLLGGVTTKVVRLSKKPVLVAGQNPGDEVAMNRVLVAVDGSPCSLRALEQAQKLAGSLRAELFLYRAVKMPWDGSNPDPLMQEAEEEMAKLAALYPNSKAEVRVYPTDHSPQVVERAEELKADLIVLGSHGRRGLQHLLMGSVAEHVVHTARCPVMVVH